MGKFLAAERKPCLGTVFSIKLFQSSERINEPKFYLHIGFQPQREQTVPILRTCPLLLRKVPAVDIENCNTSMKLAYEENSVYEY
jgi:hypothetical protein